MLPFEHAEPRNETPARPGSQTALVSRLLFGAWPRLATETGMGFVFGRPAVQTLDRAFGSPPGYRS